MKPLDTDLLGAACAGHRVIVTVEDGCVAGGLFGAVSEYVAENGLDIRVHGAGVPDEFIPQASQTEQREMCGLSSGRILETLLSLASELEGERGDSDNF